MISTTVTSGGVDLHVRRAEPADGAERAGTVVLLHGWPDSSAIWEPQVAALVAAGWRVLAPDLRGFGRSDRPRGTQAYAMHLVVADVLAVMDDAGVERAAVVGHDWGSVVAWEVAVRAPDRVRALVAISVGHPAAFTAGGLAQLRGSWYFLPFVVPGVGERLLPARRWAFLRAAWGGADPATTPGLARQVEDLSRPGALTAGFGLYRANVPPLLTARLSALRRRRGGRSRSAAPAAPRTVAAPTMGVWSGRDAALTRAQMVASERFVTGGWRFEQLDGVDHWVPVNAPQALGALLLDFLGGLHAEPAR